MTPALLAASLAAAPATAATIVNTELVLSVDVSGSINETEFNLQRQGYANAFRDPATIAAIESLEHGIAVTMQYWSTQVAPTIGWFHVTDAASAFAFAAAIEAAARPFVEGATNLIAALTSAQDLLLNNDFEGDRLVIDLSSDGRQNTDAAGLNPCEPYTWNGNIYNSNPDANCFNLLADARDRAVDASITINGLPILTDLANLDDYFATYVIGGEGAFLQAAATFSDFDSAVKAKIQREIRPPQQSVPEPATSLGLLALGMLAVRWRSR